MYEILSDVLPPMAPNQNPGVAPEHIYIYNFVDVISHVKKNTEITIKVNYTKDKAS